MMTEKSGGKKPKANVVEKPKMARVVARTQGAVGRSYVPLTRTNRVQMPEYRFFSTSVPDIC